MLGFANSQRAREGGGFFCVFEVRAPHAPHIGIAHAYPRLNMKPGDEPAADEANSKPVSRTH